MHEGNEVVEAEEDDGVIVGEGRERLIIELHLRLHESNYARNLGNKIRKAYLRVERPETIVISSDFFFLCLKLLVNDEGGIGSDFCLPLSCSNSLSFSFFSRSLSLSDCSVLKHTSSTTLSRTW